LDAEKKKQEKKLDDLTREPIRGAKSVEDYKRLSKIREEEREKEIQRRLEISRKKRELAEEGRQKKIEELKEKYFPETNVETPLVYMLRLMNDPSVPDSRRDEMAKAAAPYVHSRRVPMNEQEDFEAAYGALDLDELNSLEKILLKMQAATNQKCKQRRRG
jgi:hypothetical protein